MLVRDKSDLALTDEEERDLVYHDRCKRIGAAYGWDLYGTTPSVGATYALNGKLFEVGQPALDVLGKIVDEELRRSWGMFY